MTCVHQTMKEICRVMRPGGSIEIIEEGGLLKADSLPVPVSDQSCRRHIPIIAPLVYSTFKGQTSADVVSALAGWLSP